MADKTETTEMSEITSPTKPSFGARVVAHFKKWWWVHVILIVVVVLVVTLPVVYVAYPKIAQGDVNDSTLNITRMAISDPAPDSFHLDQIQVVGSDSMYHPTIYAFDAAVSLAGSGVAFATARVPQSQAKDGTQIQIDQRLDLSNVTAFGEFTKAAMLNEEVELNIHGKPELKQGGLPKTEVTYDKTVTMKGLNKLKGFNLTDFHVSLDIRDGPNMNGTVYIPNPSVITITLGNITMDLAVKGTHIGQCFINDLTLHPGNNTVPMSSKINATTVVRMLGDYPDGTIPVDATGNSSVYHGKELTYFTEALAANSLRLSLNVLEGL